jgi:8-oxo-dGTP diphosphatase
MPFPPLGLDSLWSTAKELGRIRTMKQIEVAALVMIEDEKVFAAQRKNSGPLGGRWEFPGGKLEAGEDGRKAILREIREELGISIEVGRYIMTVEYQYPTFFLVMHAYEGRRIEGEVLLSEHIQMRWLSKDELYSVDWAEADLPIVKQVELLLH